MWDLATGGMTILRVFWSAVRQFTPGVEGERRMAGTAEGDIVERFGRAGLEDVSGGALNARADYAGFDDFWEPFTFAVGPSGQYLHSLPDGEAPCALHFNGMIYYPDEHGGLQMVLVPWTKSIDFKMPVSIWKETIGHYFPNTAWVGLRAETLEALQREQVARGLATADDCVRDLLEESGRD